MKKFTALLFLICIIFTGCVPVYGPIETGNPIVTNSLIANGNFGRIKIDYVDPKTRKVNLNGVIFTVSNLKKLSLTTTSESEVFLHLLSGEKTRKFSYKESDLVFGEALLDKTRDSRIQTLNELKESEVNQGFVDVGENRLVRVKYYPHVDTIIISVIKYTENYR